MAQTAARKRREYAPRVPAEQRRAQLLDAALHLIATEGHGAATMEAVASQAGVTKPVLYGMFANRAELLAALLEREQEAALRQLAQIPQRTATGQAPDPAELLGSLLEGFLEAVLAAPERWHCIVMPMPDMPVEFHSAREQAREMILGLAQELGRWMVSTLGTPSDLDPELLAHTLVTLSEMAARLVLSDPDHFRPERFVRGVQAAVGLTRASAPPPPTQAPATAQ